MNGLNTVPNKTIVSIDKSINKSVFVLVIILLTCQLGNLFDTHSHPYGHIFKLFNVCYIAKM